MADLKKLSDADLTWMLQQDKRQRDALSQMPDDQLQRLLGDNTPKIPTAAQNLNFYNPKVPLTSSQVWAGRARAVGQGLGGVGDEAEAGVRSVFGADYDTTLEDIRRKYAAYQSERPIEATGIQAGTGLGTALLAGPLIKSTKALPYVSRALKAAAPVANKVRSLFPAARTAAPGFASRVPSIAARTEMQAAEAAAKRSALLRAAEVSATGGAMGAATGFAGGEGGFENRVGEAETGGILGTLGGAAVPLVAGGGRYVADVYRNTIGNMPESLVMNKAQDIILNALNRAGTSAKDVYKRALLDQRYGITPVLAHGNPELAALAETAALVPSTGRKNLLETVIRQQKDTPGRVKGTIQATVKSPDYFATEDTLINNLKTSSKPYYKTAYEHGEVNDLDLNALLENDEVKKAFVEAQKLNKNFAAGVKTPAEKAEFTLKPIFDPVLDVQGNLVGANITGVKPDVRTLDFIKRRLDTKIRGLEKGLGSDDKAQAASLKPLRDALRERMKEIVPGYKEALAQFRGDSEVAEALEKGLKDVPNMRFQEVQKLWKESSPGERAALKTGFMQRLIQPMEDATGSRNVAQAYMGENWDRKMRTILEPKEYLILKNALTRESELFTQRSAITGGSATMRRAAGKADFDKMVEGGDIAGAVDMITSPGKMTKYTLDLLGRLKRANASDAVYDRVSNMLATKTPAEIETVLRGLLNRAPQRAAQINARTARQKTVTKGLVTGLAHEPPAETTPASEPYAPDEFVAPDLYADEKPSMAPSPDLQ
jgi:hypothetical protein